MKQFQIAIHPQAKQSVRGGKNGFHSDPKKKAYQDALVLLCRKERMRFDGAVRLTLSFHFEAAKKGLHGTPKTTRPDVDNLCKPVMDALISAGFFSDDAQVAELVCRKSWGAESAITIQIENI